MREQVTIVGGGLAGSEAAWQAARLGVRVALYEMRPGKLTPVHRTGALAELVCSNSLKSLEITTPHGVLKREMETLGSLVLQAAVRTRVPAGGALAVDRDAFSAAVTRAVESHPLIEIVREEVPEIPDAEAVILAAGPLVSDRLAASIARFTGEEYLYFFDAIAPAIDASTIDREIAFSASRYGKGNGADYLNCPMTEVEYDRFLEALRQGEKAELHEVDSTPFFEGCLPIEEMARRGRDTLRFGPMKPVGLTDPRTGRRPHAVVQLRQDDRAAGQYSMVGFQTQLRRGEQRRIFRTIPGLESSEFVRLGQVHRNCYINAPRVLRETLETRVRDGLFFAGQISGVEGYTESAATGLLAGLNAARRVLGLEPAALPPDTMLGSLCRRIACAPPEDYQPTNASFGLLPEAPPTARKKRDRREAQGSRAVRSSESWTEALRLPAAREISP